jgi:hypothetical protein
MALYFLPFSPARPAAGRVSRMGAAAAGCGGRWMRRPLDAAATSPATYL